MITSLAKTMSNFYNTTLSFGQADGDSREPLELNNMFWFGLSLFGLGVFGWLLAREYQEADERSITETRKTKSRGRDSVFRKERQKHIVDSVTVKKMVFQKSALPISKSTETICFSSKESKATELLKDILSDDDCDDEIDTLKETSGSRNTISATQVRCLSSGKLCSTEQCSICLAVYKEGDVVASNKHPNCKHVFHVECLTEWLMMRSECPICRVRYFGLDLPANKNAMLEIV